MNLERITYLESIARALEPSSPERRAVREAVVRYAEEFLDRIDDLPAYRTSTDPGRGILESPIGEEPISIGAAVRIMAEHLDAPGLNPASGGHLGYIPGGGIYFSALGDYLAAVTNRYAGIYFAGPGAVRMEQMLLEWMAGITGYPRMCAGNLTSGGSIANLVGIVAARDAQGLKSGEHSRSCIYLTSQVHHSVDKAIRIAGLRECPVRMVPVDSRYRMDAGSLQEMIQADLRAGLRPWLIVASAGTTDTGAIDPLDVLSQIARRHSLWLHVDGAYGAFFVLCDEGKKLLKGMGESDSLVMDPHKGLFLPYGSGAVLVRDRQKLYDAFWYQANYLLDALSSGEELSPAEISPELTKHFRGLRLWLPLKLLGVAPFRAALEEKLLLARYFYERMQSIEGFELGPFPDLSVVTYRYLPKHGDPNAFNERLLREVQRDGRVFISSTILEGRFTLRLAVLSFRTHLSTIEYTLDILQKKARELQASF